MPEKVSLHLIETLVTAIAWPTIVGLAWKLSGRLTAIETTLSNLVNNHLKHLDDDLKLIKASLIKK